MGSCKKGARGFGGIFHFFAGSSNFFFQLVICFIFKLEGETKLNDWPGHREHQSFVSLE